MHFQLKRTEMVFLSQFNIGKWMYYGDMCYIEHSLVIRGFLSYTIKVFDEESGRVLDQWETCHLGTCLLTYRIDTKTYLLEGCEYCEVIQGYILPEISCDCKTFCETIKPNVMCEGPKNSILVLENRKSIRQLGFSGGKLHPNEFSFDSDNVEDMGFSEKDGIVLLLHQDKKSLTGIHLQSRDVIWNSELQFSSLVESPGDISNIFTIADGRVCIVTLRKVFVIDPEKGTVMYQLFEYNDEGFLWRIATCYNGHQQRLAVKSGSVKEEGKVSLYHLSPDSPPLCTPTDGATALPTR